MSTVLAVDVGGTKLAAALVDADGTISNQVQVATPASRDPDVVTGALRSAVEQALAAVPADTVVALGLGSAGPVDPAGGTVSPVNIPAWRGFGILAALADLLPDRPAALAGDGHCMGLGEYRFGGHRCRSLLGMVVSTGVGGGIVLDGKVLAGPTGNAGHIGHVIVDLDGPACPCGSRGCVEVLASGPNIARWAVEQGWVPAGDVADGRALAASARAGDPVALRAFDRSARAVAAGIVSASALVDLDEVVIGGGIAAAGDLLFTPLRAAVADLAGMEFVRRVRVYPSTLGSSAGLLGAAALALDLVAAGPDPIARV
ncbi:ROK family protein [Planosporangium sp. 12N6]|uniref:ROK family protein n=1 Tax=Planosporangium spinosum TaxID=3402278 RepID=UPI003CEFE0C3